MKRGVLVIISLVLGVLLTASSFVFAKPIKIGAVYILSGAFATYGQFARNGIELAVDEINAKNGILGRKVEVLFEDSKAKPAVALRAFRKLVYEEEVDFLVGLDSSGVALGVVPTLPELGKILIITHAATPDVTGKKCNRYAFRISVNLNQNIGAAARIATKTGAKRWTTIGPDYAFGHQSWEYFQRYLKKLMPDAVFMDKVAFPKLATEDYSSFITSIMDANPEGVLISLWGGDLVNFVRQARDYGFFDKGYKILMTLGAATEVLYALGDKMPEGLWVGTRYWFLANPSQVNKKFVEAYKSRFKAYPSYNAQNAYTAIYTLKAAIEKAKSTDTAKVIRALEGLRMEAPVGKFYIRPGDHQAVLDVTWGKTASDPNYPIRILKPIVIFKGKEVTPPVAETGCVMK